MKSDPKLSKDKLHSFAHKIEFSVTDFRLEAQDGGVLLKLKSGYLTDRIGWPVLPYVTISLLLADGAAPMSVALEHGRWRKYPQKLKFPPAQPPRISPSQLGGTSFFSPPEMAYESFPMDPAVEKQTLIADPPVLISGVSRLEGHDIVRIKVSPIRYNPRSGEVWYLGSGTMRIDYRLRRGSKTKRVWNPMTAAMAVERLTATISNTNMIDASLRAQADPFALAPGNLPPPVTQIPRPENWPYLIITDNYAWSEQRERGRFVGELIAEFERLARWKTIKGIRARVVSITDIMANRFGTHNIRAITRDTQEAIRNFLKHAFYEWDTRWCLLGGDINIVPARHVLEYGVGWAPPLQSVNRPKPGPGEIYLDVSSGIRRVQTQFQLTTDDVFFVPEVPATLRYRSDASVRNPGWQFTDSTYLNPSSVPTRYVTIHGRRSVIVDNPRTFVIPQYYNLLPTDYYYSSLDSPLYTTDHDWDSDNNGIYGWINNNNPDGVDLVADVSVGRAPVIDVTSARTFVDKVHTYETFHDTIGLSSGGSFLANETIDFRRPDGLPHLRGLTPLSAGYVRKVLCVADTFGGGWLDGPFERVSWGPLDGASADKEQVIARLREANVECDDVRRFYEDVFFMARHESNLRERNPSSPVLAALNQGVHFLTISGHGLWYGTAGFDSTGTTGTYVSGMTNWPHLPIVWIDSCFTNEYDRDHWATYNREGGAQAGVGEAASQVCLCKNMVRRPRGGAVACVGYCRFGIAGLSPELFFWEALSLPGQAHLGKMFDHARWSISARSSWMAYTANLMGDPELQVRKATPKHLSISHPAQVYPDDRLIVSVFCEGVPVTDARVCISTVSYTNPLDKVHYPMVAAEHGHYTFDVASASQGRLFVTVAGANYVPYVETILKMPNPSSRPIFKAGRHLYAMAERTTDSLYAASGDGSLYALSRDGGVEWSMPIGSPVQNAVSGGDRTVLAGTYFDSGPNPRNNLILFTSDGSVARQWSLDVAIRALALSEDNRLIVVGAEGFWRRRIGFYVYDKTSGRELFRQAQPGTAMHVAIQQNAIYATYWTTDNRTHLIRYDRRGREQYSFALPATSTSLLVDTNQNVYVGTANHQLRAINPDGELLWEQASLGSAVTCLLKIDKVIYAGLGYGYVAEFSARDGSLRRQTSFPYRVDCLAAGDGRGIYVGYWRNIAFLRSDGIIVWQRSTSSGVICLLRLGRRLFAGTREGRIYRIDL